MEQLARSTDPGHLTPRCGRYSSSTGDADVGPPAGLPGFGDLGLTADEAGEDADLTHTGYWKRCSDLYQAGFTRTLMDGDRVVTRPGRAGSSQEVRIITSKGRSWIGR
jgi:hypothetical protein